MADKCEIALRNAHHRERHFSCGGQDLVANGLDFDIQGDLFIIETPRMEVYGKVRLRVCRSEVPSLPQGFNGLAKRLNADGSGPTIKKAEEKKELARMGLTLAMFRLLLATNPTNMMSC